MIFLSLVFAIFVHILQGSYLSYMTSTSKTPASTLRNSFVLTPPREQERSKEVTKRLKRRKTRLWSTGLNAGKTFRWQSELGWTREIFMWKWTFLTIRTIFAWPPFFVVFNVKSLIVWALWLLSCPMYYLCRIPSTVWT